MKATAQVGILLAVSIAMTTTHAQKIPSSGGAAPTNSTGEMSLTNQTVFLLAQLRGVSEAEVRIHIRSSGAFEIDLSGSKDWETEAVELSKALGSSAAVIVEHASGDGLIRTNWTFKAGVVEKRTAPAGSSGLKPSGQRMYVWPRPAAPGRVRVRASAE